MAFLNRKAMPGGAGATAIISALLLFLVCAGLWAATPSDDAASKYNGGRGFTLNYPKSWAFADFTNVDTLLTLMNRVDSLSAPGYLPKWNTVARRVKSGNSAALFWDSGLFDYLRGIEVLVVPIELSVKESSAKELQPLLLESDLPYNSDLVSNEVKVRKAGSRKILRIVQVYEDPKTREGVELRSAYVRGSDRGFLLISSSDLGQEPCPLEVLEMLAFSLKDTRPKPPGLVSLPLWAELLILGVVAIVIAILLISFTGDYSPTIHSRSSRRKKNYMWQVLLAAFFIWLAFIGLAQLFNL